MLKVLSIIFALVAAGRSQYDPATKQLAMFKNRTTNSIGIITTTSGAPVEYKETRCTLDSNLLFNQHFVESITHAVRERIPERTLHAPGAGAFGYFETTDDISHICKAKLFSEVGKKTPVAVRFSLTGPKSGTYDTTRETSRGMAVKFYTEEGNLDLPGLNTPCFTFKDPILFPHLSHIMKPNPTTNLPDSNMLWDFLTLHPESWHQTFYLLSDYGYPYGYRHMPGYPIHTYQVYNEKGNSSFVRFHFIPDAGIKHFNSKEAVEITASDSNYFTRDLYNAIANGENPSWQLKLQILSEADVNNATIDVFDVTNILPVDLYPLHSVGKMTLNKNANNYFAEIEQIAFCPSNLVPGILGGPDKLFEGRRFAYREAHLYRLGSNYNKITVNCPIPDPLFTYYRDGAAPVNDNGGNGANYYPNSFNGAIPYENDNRPPLIKVPAKESNNFEQASNFYSKTLSSSEQSTLIANIIKSMCSCEEMIKLRAVHWLKIINSDIGNRIAEGLAANCSN